MNDQPTPEPERLTEALQREELQERVNNLSGMLAHQVGDLDTHLRVFLFVVQV